MTVSRAHQMYTHGSWTVPQAKAYLETRYNASRLAVELIDQWELHHWWSKRYYASKKPAPASDIPREDLIALISTAYECKGITQLEAERLFGLLGMDVKEARSQLQMVDDNALIVAIFGTAPPGTVSTKQAILDRLDRLVDSHAAPEPWKNCDGRCSDCLVQDCPGRGSSVRPPQETKVADGPTYPNCKDKCRTCANNACDMYREN